MQKKNIIIIFPSDIDQFRVANYSFRSFNSDEAKPGTEFFHVVHTDHRESFQVRNGSVYDVSDDWIPIYDKSDLPGFYMAVGSSGNQYKNAPIAGVMMTELIEACEKGQNHDQETVKLHLNI